MLQLTENLKTVQFDNGGGRLVDIAYAIFKGKNCVFTAIEPSTGASTINFAEDIALAIAKQEGRNVFDLRFFDRKRPSLALPGQN